ncbi:MAG TPA: hypothetical protein VJ725_34690 [Thermoanaerobaculia bacterium]|nr:hypothetical protein [Thermoanaerobaculia bacterium]
MSTFGTAYNTILARCNKPAADATRVKVALCDTIQMHRHERFHWNQARFSITLTATFGTYGVTSSTGVAAGLPADLISIVGKTLSLLYAGVATDQHDVLWVPREMMDRLRDSPSGDGTPQYWSFWDERLELYPASDLSTHVLKGSYIADVGTPRYTATSPTAFAFLNPAGGAAADADTSSWFDMKQGFQLTTWHAEYLLWTSVWQGVAGQGERALQRYLEAKASQSDVTASQAPPRQNMPWMPWY